MAELAELPDPLQDTLIRRWYVRSGWYPLEWAASADVCEWDVE